MPHYAATVRDDCSLELPKQARQYVKPGQMVDVDLPDFALDNSPQPSFDMRTALDRIAKRQEGRPQSDGSKSLQFLREARDGGMYDVDPAEKWRNFSNRCRCKLGYRDC